MTKKIFLVSALFIGTSFVAHADFSAEQWQYKKAISGFKEGLVRVSLDNEVFANASKNLTDVRVVDNSGKEIPYKLITAKNEEGVKTYHPKMINNSIVSGKYSTVILDLGEQGIITNSLTVQTPSENFQRNVTVYGSDNQNDWNILKSNSYIYDYTDKRGNMKSQNTSVFFTDSSFKFLKIEISDSDNNPIAISSVTVNKYIQKTAQQFGIPVQFETSQDGTEKTTNLVADLGQSGIPVNKISLTADGENFNRGVSIYSSNDKNSADWKYVGQGYIFRYNTPKFVGENTVLNINETTDRYIKIVVFNNDNAALSFSKIEAFATYREVIFQALDKNEYQLFYGNSEANLPAYDLESYLQYFDLASAQKGVLGSQNNNAQFVPKMEPEKPFSERMPYFLPVALGTLGLILLLLVYKFLKKTTV